jgi:hypothetical protein
MLRQMVKIANKLDSLGLTKEADVLDRYIHKMAKDTGVNGQKYIDAYGSELSGLPLSKLFLELKNELSGGWNGTTDSGGIFSSGITKIEAIFYYLFRTIGDYITYDMILQGIKNVGYDAGAFTGLEQALDDEETGLASKCNLARDAGIADYNVANPEAPTPTTPPPDPWATYGSDAKRLRDAWTKRTIATKKNPSFDNFQAWLRNRSVDKKNVNAIIQVLVAETTGATDPLAGGRLAIPSYVAEKSSPIPSHESRWGGPSPSASVQTSRPTGGGTITERTSPPPVKSGPPIGPDAEVTLGRATR